MTEHLKRTWNNIIKDENHHIIVNEIDGKIVSSCVCVIIPNITRNIRPYAFVENVVTHIEYHGKGYATECLDYAKEIAKKTIAIKLCCLQAQRKNQHLIFTVMQDITAQIKQHLYNGSNRFKNWDWEDDNTWNCGMLMKKISER